MKKLIALLLACAMSLSLVACGGTSTQQPASGTQSSSQAEESSQGETSQPEQYDPADANQADTSAEGSQSAVSESQGAVTVSLEQVDHNVNAEDGTQVIEAFYFQPTVTIAGNEEAQTAIQEALDQEIADFLSYVDGNLTTDVNTFYEEWRAEAGEEADFSEHGYYDELRITVKRADEQVISLVLDNIGYSGGAHGWDSRYAMNFDTQTGARLTFDMLGENFKTTAEELVLEAANQMQEDEGCFFPDYETCIPLLMVDGSENAQDVYAQVYPEYYGEDASDPITVEGSIDAAFYLDDTGVTFISTEYLMQSYAAGIIELPITYDDLAGSINEYYVK
jgi:hypothetical protein